MKVNQMGRFETVSKTNNASCQNQQNVEGGDNKES